MMVLLAVIMLLARVKKPGQRQDWASIPNLTSLTHSAWSSRRQSQPGILSRKAWGKVNTVYYSTFEIN